MGRKAVFFFTNIDEKAVFNMDWLNHALLHLLDEVSSCASINIVDQFLETKLFRQENIFF